MAPFTKTFAGLFAALIIGVAAAPASAEDCPRGALDKAYCDRNADLVADTPTDAKQLVNPSTLIFSYTPVEDPAVYAKVWDGFVQHMERVPAKRSCSFRCNRTPHSLRRCAPAACMSRV